MTIRPWTLYFVASSAGSQPPITDHMVLSAVVIPGQYDWRFKHPLATSSFGIAVIPNWNTTYWVTGTTDEDFTIRFGTAPPAVGATLTYRLSTGRGSSVVVAADATSKAVTHSLGDAVAGWQATPSWNTTVWASSKAANIVTFSFGTPAPSEGGRLYYGRFNTPGSYTFNNATAGTGVTSMTTTHSLNRFADTLAMTTWNTTRWVQEPVGVDTATIRFGTPAPSGGALDTVSGLPVDLIVGSSEGVSVSPGDLELLSGESLELVGGGELELVA